jgi:hypothetical protein
MWNLLTVLFSASGNMKNGRPWCIRNLAKQPNTPLRRSKKIACLAIDPHARHGVLGHIDFDGIFVGNKTFPTSEQNITEALRAVKAEEKYLALCERKNKSVITCILEMTKRRYCGSKRHVC